LDITTPYDDIIPIASEPDARFYIDAMRIYLGLYEGTISMEEAIRASISLKENPEFAKYPVNPTVIPLNEDYKNRIISNLETLKKFNLLTKDSVKSAFTFALLTPETPISNVDLQVLHVLEKDPMITLVKAAETIGATSRTIARSIDRLERTIFFRTTALMDMTAFGAYPFILFFTLAEGVEWETVEDGLALFPLTKNILKTSMTDLGYASFLIPGPKENLATFRSQVKNISQILFDYSSLHQQEASGTDTNLSLYQDGQWAYSEVASNLAEGEILPRDDERINVLECKDWVEGLTERDFIVASEYRDALRDPPRVFLKKLHAADWNFDSKQVMQSVRKSHSRNLILPFIFFRGVGLSTNFCFEIVCDETWRKRIMLAVTHFPSATYFLSPRGIIIWTQVPSNQQVEYYQAFRSLEDCNGVDSVQPIMTIFLKGSRSELDFTQRWKFGSNGWTCDRSLLDFAGSFSY
jgi:DNA-binding Lrp family transcriptional regulator